MRSVLVAMAVVLSTRAAPLIAQPTLGLGGYLKNLAIGSHSVFDDKPYWLDLTRYRFQLSARSGRWHAETWLDSEIYAGSWFDAPEATLSDAVASESFVDLDWTVLSADRLRISQRVFRATLAWYGDAATVTAGRQRVAWGTGFVWTPTDVLNPLEPAAIERDEKPGVDAVQVVVPLGPLSAVEAVFAPGRHTGEHRTAGRLRGHVGEYDWTVMGGRFADRWIVGGDFAGYVVDGGLRGEAAMTRDPDGNWTLRAVANADYTLEGGWYLFVEGHYNGPGASRTSDYDRLAVLSGRMLNLGKWYGATGITYLWSPLVTANLYVVHNLTDGSSLIGPGFTWSVVQNAELAGGIYIFSGSDSSEYGVYRDAAFVSFQVFF